MSNARSLAELLGTDSKIKADDLDVGQIGGRRNLIINGKLDIWQRGANVSGVSFSGICGADRWRSHGSIDASQQEFTPGQTDVPGEPKYYARHTPTSNDCFFLQKIEDARTGAGQTVTFSFYARASTTKAVNMQYRQRFDSASSNVFHDFADEFTLTTTWQKFTHTTTLPSVSGKTIGASSFLEVGVGKDNVWTTNDYIDFCLVQLEVGTVATPFEHRSYGEELALCQRYYQYVERARGSGNGDQGGNVCAYSHRIPEMRAQPTCTLVSGGTPYNYTNPDFQNENTSHIALLVDVTDSGYWYFNDGYRLEAEL